MLLSLQELEEKKHIETSPSTISIHSNSKIDKHITAELSICSLHLLRFSPDQYIQKYQLKYGSSYGSKRLKYFNYIN